MAVIKLPVFQASIIEGLSRVLGDTADGLSGQDIGRILQQTGISDINHADTKWKRLYFAFVNNQNRHQCSNQILNFIANALAPGRFMSDRNKFNFMRSGVNEVLALVGYEIRETGKFVKVTAATTISEAKSRANNLRSALIFRNSHERIFIYCNEELLAENYYHAAFEAIKSVFERIREITELDLDGYKLIDIVFNSTSPKVIINNFMSDSEKNEHIGFSNLLKGFCSMFRNPLAHDPKIKWNMNENDALDIMTLASYFHRRLDNSHRIN